MLGKIENILYQRPIRLCHKHASVWKWHKAILHTLRKRQYDEKLEIIAYFIENFIRAIDFMGGHDEP